MIHTSNIGTAKGNQVYNTWIQEKKNLMSEIEEEKVETVFDKLKKASRSNTLFHRMKHSFNKGNNN